MDNTGLGCFFTKKRYNEILNIINMKKKLIIAIIIIIVLAFIVVGLVSRNGKEEIELFEVSMGTVVKEVSETGTVRSTEEIDMGFKTSGRIQEILVKKGDEVEKGQELIKLDAANLAIQLQEAKAALQIIKAQKTDAGLDLDTAQQNLIDVIATADDDLNSAYQDALSVLDSVYLKVYNSYNVVSDLQRNYFTSANSTGLSVMTAKKRIGNALDKIDDYTASLGNSSENKDIDLGLSDVKDQLEVVADSLEIVRDAVGRVSYSAVISSTEIASVDTQNSSINSEIIDITNAQQAISSTKIDNEKNINTAQSSVDSITTQLQENGDGLYQAQIRQAQAKVDLLANQIQDAYLRSPIDGKIVQIEKETGENVQANEIIVSLLSTDSFQIEVDIYEEDIVNVEIGDPVEIDLVAFPDEMLLGQVIAVDPGEKVVDEVVYYEVTIGFSEMKAGVRNGMTADLIIQVAKKENVLVVPRRAVDKNNGDMIVKVMEGKKEVEKTIQVGLKGDEFYEVVSGLEQGQKVIID